MVYRLYELLERIFDCYENTMAGVLTKGGLIAHFEIEGIAFSRGRLVLAEVENDIMIDTVNNFIERPGCIDISLPNASLSIIYE